jgi:hypothetical protein
MRVDQRQMHLFQPTNQEQVFAPTRGAALPSGVPEDAKSRRENVWRLLRDGQWHTTMEINDVTVGGSEGCRRLRELRRLVRNARLPPYCNIQKRKVPDSNQWEYLLI